MTTDLIMRVNARTTKTTTTTTTTYISYECGKKREKRAYVAYCCSSTAVGSGVLLILIATVFLLSRLPLPSTSSVPLSPNRNLRKTEVILASCVPCTVGRVLYPSWGTTPRNFSIFRQGRRSCAATCQITREDGAILDVCKVVFGSIAFFPLHARGSSL